MSGCFGNNFFDRNMERQLMNHLDEESNFDNWVEELFEKFSDDFYNKNQEWIDTDMGYCTKWINDLYKKGKTSIEAAAIMERAFVIYKQ